MKTSKQKSITFVEPRDIEMGQTAKSPFYKKCNNIKYEKWIIYSKVMPKLT